MSRPFRWFLLGACVFLTLLGGGDALRLVAQGPQAASQPSELVREAARQRERNAVPRVDRRVQPVPRAPRVAERETLARRDDP